MLDTNAASQAIRSHPQVIGRLLATPLPDLCVSSVTRGELLFGVAKRPKAKALQRAVEEFLLRVETLPWDSASADHYSAMRARLERRGKPLGALDMMIAAHAASVGATLVSHDAAFGQVEGLELEDWEVG